MQELSIYILTGKGLLLWESCGGKRYLGQLTIDNYEDVNYVDRVSCKEIIVYTGKESPLHFPITTPTAQLNCQLSTVN